MSGVPAAPERDGAAAIVVAPRAREAVARLERSERMRLSYLETLAEPLPLVTVPADFEERFDRLGAEFPNAAPAIARLRDEARLRAAAGVRGLCFRPLLLVGPPGVGKSRFAGASRPRSASPPRRPAWPGRATPANSRARRGAGPPRSPAGRSTRSRRWAWPTRSWSVDEVDKAAREGRNGDPLAAMLPFLEPGTAAAHRDPVLGAPCDLSAVSWVLAANDAWRLPGPLLSRLRVVEMGPPPAGGVRGGAGGHPRRPRGGARLRAGAAAGARGRRPGLAGAQVARSAEPARAAQDVERLLGAAAARRPAWLN
jgi:hypothetical protein